MVNPLIRGYFEVQLGQERLEQADRRVRRAYQQLQATIRDYGPEPDHGWWRVKLTAHEDAVKDALAQYQDTVCQLATLGSGLPQRPPW